MTSLNSGGKKGEIVCSTRIFNLSLYGLTQILSRRTCWMQNLFLHPMSTHVAYFRWTLLHEKCEIHEKRDCTSRISHFCVVESIERVVTHCIMSFQLLKVQKRSDV